MRAACIDYYTKKTAEKGIGLKIQPTLYLLSAVFTEKNLARGGAILKIKTKIV